MGKRLRRSKPICCCVSPRSSSFSLLPPFSFYEDDIWTEIAKYLDAKSLVMLATTCKWFYSVAMEDSVWKFAFLRDLQVPDPGKVAFKWSKLYAKAVGTANKAMGAIRTSSDRKTNILDLDWVRIGAFSFSSPSALLTDKLSCPKIVPTNEPVEKTVKNSGLILLSNIKDGIWIADLQLVRCPVCDLNTCDGTMQILDARHMELFLHKGFQDGSWQYTLLGTHEAKKNVEGACGAIVDLKYLKDDSTAGETTSFHDYIRFAIPEQLLHLHSPNPVQMAWYPIFGSCSAPHGWESPQIGSLGQSLLFIQSQSIPIYK